MKLRKTIRTASIVASLSLGITGSALAADADVSYDTTGPDSVNKTEISESTSVDISNSNTVVVVNENVQSATTGDVSANKNTTVGDLTSGDASNENDTATTVSIANNADAVSSPGGNGQGNGNVGGVGGSGGSSAAAGGSGSVQGASTVGGQGAGVAVLPEVGASVPVDVSALRAAWQAPSANSSAAKVLSDGSRWLTTAMLVTASLLGLLGALVSTLYTRRRQMRV